MKKISTFVFLCCLALTVSAQSNYKKGYIITNNNDTIRGLIDFKTDKSNSSICRFKSSEKEAEQVYHPEDIWGYMLINEVKFYVSKSIEIDNKSYKVFLEYLVKGVKDLYYYPKDNGYYFFEDENGKLVPITQNVNVQNKYKNTLNYIFRDCLAVTKDVDKINFERSDMIELTKNYHRQMCSPGEECIVFQNDYKQKFIEVNFALYGGAQLTELSFKQHSIGGLETTRPLPDIIRTHRNFKSISPVIGGQADISSPRITNSFSLLVDASMSNIKGECNYFTESSNHEFSSYQVYKFNSLLTTTGLGLKYTYPKGNFRPSIEVGASYSFLVNSSNSLYSEARSLDKLTQEKIDNFHPLRSYFFGYNCGIGFNYLLNKKHTIFYKITYAILNNYENKIKATQLKVGYTF